MIRDIPTLPVTAEAVAGLPDQPLEDGVNSLADAASAAEASAVDTLPAERLFEFAALARESANDYRQWAIELPKLAQYYTKCANDRQAHAEWYEREGLRKINLSEAAE